MATHHIEDIYRDVTTVTPVLYTSKGPHIQVTISDSKAHSESTAAYTPDATQELIQALETAQKELDPSYQTRAEIQAERDALLEDASRANQ